MRRPFARRGEEGGIAITMGVLALLLSTLAIALLHGGHRRIDQQRLQNAADSMALLAASALTQNEAIELETLAGPVAVALELDPVRPQISLRTARRQRLVEVRLRQEVEGPYRLGRALLDARATARIHEARFADDWPLVIIVLDASGSMTLPVDDRRTSKFDRLVELLQSYAARPFPARNGLVVFNDQVIARVPPPTGQRSNLPQITSALAGAIDSRGGDSRGEVQPLRPGGRTDIAAALRAAREMLEPAADEKRQPKHVLLLTDGNPNAGGEGFWSFLPWSASHKRAAAHEAERIRELGAALFSIEVGHRPGGRLGPPRQSAFLGQIAGGPASGGEDPRYHFQVDDLRQVDAFVSTMARAVCAYGPIALDRDDGETNHVAFVEDVDGLTRRLDPLPCATDDSTLDTGPDAGGSYRFCEDSDGRSAVVTLDRGTCHALGAGGGRLLVRWGTPRLVE